MKQHEAAKLVAPTKYYVTIAVSEEHVFGGKADTTSEDDRMTWKKAQDRYQGIGKTSWQK